MDALKLAKSGDAILGVPGNDYAFPNAHRLRERFTVHDLYDLCVALEAVVLHERLFVVGPDPSEAMFYVVLGKH